MTKPPRSTKHTVLVLAKACIAIGLFAWLIESGRLDLRPLLTTSQLWLHAAALAIMLVSIVVQAVRWRALLAMQTIEISVAEAVRLTFIGYSGSLVLPGSAGGDVVKAYYVARHAPDRKVAGSLSVLVDRFLGMYSLVALGVVAMVAVLAAPGPHPAAAPRFGATLGVVLAATTAGAVVARFARIRVLLSLALPRRLRAPLVESLEAFSPRPADVLIPLLLSLGASVALVADYVIAARVAGADVGLLTVCAVTPLVVLASVIPLAPNGLGVAEAAAAVLFGQFGVGAGAAIMVLYRVWMLVACLPGFVLFISGSAGRRSPVVAPESGS